MKPSTQGLSFCFLWVFLFVCFNLFHRKPKLCFCFRCYSTSLMNLLKSMKLCFLNPQTKWLSPSPPGLTQSGPGDSNHISQQSLGYLEISILLHTYFFQCFIYPSHHFWYRAGEAIFQQPTFPMRCSSTSSQLPLPFPCQFTLEYVRKDRNTRDITNSNYKAVISNTHAKIGRNVLLCEAHFTSKRPPASSDKGQNIH